MATRPETTSNVASSSAMTINELEKQVEEWVMSSEGTASLLKTKESARIAAETVTADAQVEAAQLRQAVTL